MQPSVYGVRTLQSQGAKLFASVHIMVSVVPIPCLCLLRMPGFYPLIPDLKFSNLKCLPSLFLSGMLVGVYSQLHPLWLQARDGGWVLWSYFFLVSIYLTFQTATMSLKLQQPSPFSHLSVLPTWCWATNNHFKLSLPSELSPHLFSPVRGSILQ